MGKNKGKLKKKNEKLEGNVNKAEIVNEENGKRKFNIRR
jgi:hypothetical protein